MEADLIEAGLAEGAGRFTLAPLSAFCEGVVGFRIAERARRFDRP
jgi:hypothetical protein